MILVRMNHLELITESKRTRLSIMRFCKVQSANHSMSQRPDSSYLIRFFQKHLIVFAESNTEDDGGDIFKAMNPFLPFASLSTHIKHTISVSIYRYRQWQDTHCMLS
jgi:hypothetical protein